MKFLMKLFVLIAISLSGVAHADTNTSTCHSLLTNAAYSKVIQRLERLNPDLKVSKAELLILLKRETWKYLPNGYIPWKDKPQLEISLRQHIQQEFARQYRMEDMDEQDIYLFYTNQLRSIYLMTVRIWMEEELKSLQIIDQELKAIGLSLMSNYLDTASLLSVTYSPESVEELLNDRTWKTFPWDKLGQLDQLPTRQRELLELAKREPGFAQTCCDTTPGCFMCPNSRSWLRPKEKR